MGIFRKKKKEKRRYEPDYRRYDAISDRKRAESRQTFRRTIAAVFFATFIYTGVKLITSSIAFWTKRSGSITYMFYMVNDFAKYPTTIYNRFIRGIITYIIPFAFTAFYPASYFIRGGSALFCIGGTVLMATVLMAVGILVWNLGVRAYESAGS